MTISISSKALAAKVFYYLGVTERKLNILSKDRYLILMYHRVIPFKEAEPGLQAGMYVEPETFKIQINYLKEHFNILPLDKILSYINGTPDYVGKQPVCFLTFDDGWYDFYKYAYPVLLENSVPATVFLPTNYIGSVDKFWTDQIANIIYNYKERIKYKDHNNNMIYELVQKLESLNGTIEIKIEKAISFLKNYRDEDVLKVIKILQIRWRVPPVFEERCFLNWKEVREMAYSGIVTFGSHGMKHNILTHLNNSEILDELNKSKHSLISEGVVKSSFIPFCYPNGNYNDTIMKMVDEVGYQIALTTEKGWNKLYTHRFNLKRVAIHQDMSSSCELFGCRIVNLI